MTSLCARGLYYVGNLCFLRVTVTFGFICRVFFLFALARLLQPTIISPPSVFCFVFFCFLNAAVFVVSVIRQQKSGADEALAALTPPPQTRRHRQSAGQRRVLLGTQSSPSIQMLLSCLACAARPAQPGDVAAPIISPQRSSANSAHVRVRERVDDAAGVART